MKHTETVLAKISIPDDAAESDGSIADTYVRLCSGGVGAMQVLYDRKSQTPSSEERAQLLRQFVESVPIALAILDHEMRYLAVSKRFLDDHQMGDSDPVGRCHYDFFPDTPALWRDYHRRGLEGETISYEYPLAMAEEGRAWSKRQIKPWFEDGRIGGIFLFSELVTDNVSREKELQFATLVYQDSGEAIMILNADNRIVAINPAFERIIGYSTCDVVGGGIGFLRSERHDSSFYEAMLQSVRDSGKWKSEIWSHRRNGEAIALSVSINTIFNIDGSVHRRFALFSDITHKKESERLIWRQANLDSLTGLPNRRLFCEHLKKEIGRASHSGSSLALLFLDLDGFKFVNDTLGHDMGDILLRDVSKRLQDSVRKSDIVSRLGGDEFTILISDLHDPNNAKTIAENILKKLSEPFRLKHEVAHISASIGITLYPDDAEEMDGLLKNADQAMYASKQQGRNRLCFFIQSMQDAAQARRRLLNDLHLALDKNEFRAVYQPIVELATGIIRKAEALIRWQHPERGLVSPAEFIPVAEETGMIHDIGEWIFREATAQAVQWRALHHEDFQISINMSPAQFRIPGWNQRTWDRHLQTIGLPGKGLTIEITEGLLLDASPDVIDQLLAFRAKGIGIALDDFGTGYSSMSYLKKFDIDFLKIDQMFIRNLGEGSDDLALCEAIIAMAHKLGIKVIAEGVETDKQRSLLTTVGCDFAQGYLYSKPLPAHDFERFLEQNAGSERHDFCI